MGEATTRTPRVYTRVTDEPGVYEIWRRGNKIGGIFRAEDRAGIFWAWNVFFEGRFGGSSQTNVRLESIAAALAACRSYLKKVCSSDR